MPISCSHGDDVGPSVEFARPFGATTGSAGRPVGGDGKRSSPAGGDGDDVAPLVDVALPVLVPPGGQDRPVAAETDRVRTTGVRCGVHVSRSDRDDVAPADRLQLLRPGGPAVTTDPSTLTPIECRRRRRCGREPEGRSSVHGLRLMLLIEQPDDGSGWGESWFAWIPVECVQPKP